MLDEILADCLDALAKGATIRDCLTRYPAEAAALEPLLRLVIALSREGETRLSTGAFEQGRRRLMNEARARQQQANHKAEIHHRQPRHTPTLAPQQRPPLPPYQQNGRPLPPRPMGAKPAQWQIQMPRLLRVALVLLTLVSATTFIRHLTTSLPGTWLYPLKSSSERMVGVLMIAAGEEIRWQGSQIERRLQELNGLTTADITTVQSATATLEGDWQELLTASEALSADERVALLAAQIDRFQQFERSWANRQGVAPQAAVVTVRRLIVAAEAALATPTPVEEATIVAVTATALAPITTPTTTPTTTATATVTATPTALLQPSATAPVVPTLEATFTPTPSPTLALATATAVPPSPTEEPTPLPEITAQIPHQEASDQESDKSEQKDDETASGADAPTSTPEPLTTEATATDVATVTPAVGTGPEESLSTPTALSTEAAATPTTAAQTPTVSSGEGTFPLPTKAMAPATATPEPGATNTTRPTNQPNATKTPKATATQAHTELATPNVPTVAPPTSVERTPIATKEAATETPVAAVSPGTSSPTVRATTAGSEATKAPQP